MVLLRLKYAIILLAFILFVLFLRKLSKAPKDCIDRIKVELANTANDKWSNILSPQPEMEEKVREYKRNKKKVKSQKKRRSGSKVSKNKHEERVRELLEDYFDDYFPTCRPKFLRNPKTGRCLELDGYNARLNLAFEYQGVQHRKYTPKFHSSPEAFEEQVYRDRIKKEILRNLEIDLIEIPDTVKYDDLKYYLMSSLAAKGYIK